VADKEVNLLTDKEARPLYLAKLTAEMHEQQALTSMRQIELQRALDQEDDRKVKSGYVRHLSVNDVIVSPNTDVWIDALEHWHRRDPASPVTISLNSPGGAVLDGFALYDTIARMQRSGTKVEIRGSGLVASMAAVLLQVADDRVLDKNAIFMIHEISCGARGKLSEIEDAQAFSKKLQDRLLDILASKSKLSKTQIARRWKRKDDYMDADEALKLGFCDRVE
jgi:ATP-dependent Clp endopeptidase proteolytic subunit ClpP